MSRKKEMTHEEHVELAQLLADINLTLQKAQSITGTKLGVTSPAYKKLWKTSRVYDAARSALDDAYHEVTSNEQFAKEGHVYYGGRNEQ
jgi:hypothetical protein